MLVCGKKDVYKYLDKERLETIYLTEEFNDKKILDLIKEVNLDEEIVEIKYVKRDELDKMTDEEHEDIIGEKKSMLPFIIILILSILLLIFITFGTAFSVYQVVNKRINGNNEIKEILFNYSDVNGNGNGIYLTNAVSMSDNEGKNLTGRNQYFDFNVSGKLENMPFDYYILLNVDSSSTLNDKDVKVYLTQMNGNIENSVQNVKKISDLQIKYLNGIRYRVLYLKEFGISPNKFIDYYRLRIWVSDDATDYYSKSYKLKVDVYGEGK